MSEQIYLSNTKQPVYRYLDVPFEQKDEAKKLGARWDPKARLWFAPWGGPRNEELTRLWPHPYIYIGIANQRCHKCGAMTPVVAFGKVDTGFMEEGYAEGPLLTLNRHPENVPLELRNFLYDACGLQNSPSKTMGEVALHNHCKTPGCNAYQGDFFLYNEVDSPFNIMDRDEIRAIEYFQVPVKWVYGEPYAMDLNYGGLMYSYADAHHRCLFLGITEAVMFDMSE